VHHLPVMRYVTPQTFDDLKQKADAMGFNNTASGPMVRSSYHADLQANHIV
jgi:lipoic acid synthetase